MRNAPTGALAAVFLLRVYMRYHKLNNIPTIIPTAMFFTLLRCLAAFILRTHCTPRSTSHWQSCCMSPYNLYKAEQLRDSHHITPLISVRVIEAQALACS
ncbi:hypothetical protein BDU57DRAFT_140542 [Ampelomyces quisqualis]|uniref:Uncharacterized protein n=1 Tax=Ampelomyces quisqualis TaxID=50730 RepID=A0A6A5QVH4_AMPQU|nr:hypothetical protein BDU57DRAFT_140542 [Ampelomyces quisqualis]